MAAVGDILSGRYLLKNEIGAGGMGTVYRAVDLRTGGEVAVKLPHAALARDHEYIERLRREAEIAASLTSSRVARVTDFAEHNGEPYLVMEYCPGESLADRLERGGPMSVDEMLHIGLELARALEAAHQRGITHRDLKPHNVRLNQSDVKVLDFGIARLEGQRGLTAAGAIIGSPEYLAPERAEGMGDIRSDIYSLGIIFYQMLTGRVPFDGATPWTVIRRHVTEPPPSLPFGLPAVVEQIVRRCLEKRPEDRYQTPAELAAALQAAQRAVTRETGEMRLTPPTQRIRLPSNASSAPTLVGPAPFGTGELADRPDGAGHPPVAPPQSDTGETPSEPPPAVTPPTVIRPLPIGTGPVTAPPTMEHTPPTVIAPRAHDTGETPVSPPPPTVSPFAAFPPPSDAPPAAASGGGRRLSVWVYVAVAAVVVAVALIIVWRLRDGDGSATQSGTGGSPAASPSAGGPATPAGTPAVQGAPPSLEVAFPAEGAQVASPVRIEVKVGGATLRPATEGDPNGRHLHYFVDTQPAAVLSPGQPVPTGINNIVHSAVPSLTRDLPPGPHTVWVVLTDNDHLPLQPNVEAKVSFTVTGTPARGADQAPLVYQSLVDGKWRLFVMSGAGGDVRRLTTGNWDDVEPSWSPDGTRVVFASNRDGRFHLYTMNADGSNVQQLTRGDFQDRDPVWSPDQAWIAFSSDRTDNRSHIFVIPAGGGEPRQITSGQGVSSQPTWSADSKQLAFLRPHGSVTQIFTVDTGGGEPKQITSANQRHIDPSWSPDGRRIAFSAFRENRWNIFVMNADGSDVQQLTRGDPQDRHPTWSPDGRQIAFASGREGQQQIFAVPVEGGGQIRGLTEGLAHNLHPAWPRR